MRASFAIRSLKGMRVSWSIRVHIFLRVIYFKHAVFQNNAFFARIGLNWSNKPFYVDSSVHNAAILDMLLRSFMYFAKKYDFTLCSIFHVTVYPSSVNNQYIKSI